MRKSKIEGEQPFPNRKNYGDFGIPQKCRRFRSFNRPTPFQPSFDRFGNAASHLVRIFARALLSEPSLKVRVFRDKWADIPKYDFFAKNHGVQYR